MPRFRQARGFRHKQRKQRGAALMVMLIIMVVGSAAFLVSSLSSSALRIEQDQNSSQILARAKEEVMGKIMSATGGQIPGNLFRPDAFASTESPYNYDGAADSGCFDASKPGSTPIPGLPLISSGINMRCLGRLPWKDYGMSISSPSENDPPGIMPWYAVSANLVDPANIIFNSDLLNANPIHPWLTVRDMNGNVLSNRVAIVIIVPVSALPGQSRPTLPLGGPNQYLDSITVPAGCTAPCIPGTYNNFDLDDDFVIGDEFRWIADPNNPAKQIKDSSYQYNDKLAYITIDELMPLIEKRVGNEIKKVLKTYYAAWGGDTGGGFPFAAPFADPSTSTFTGQASPAKYDGLLPIGNNVMPTWAALPTISISGGGSLPDCELKDGAATNSRWRCGDTNAHGFDLADPLSYVYIPAGGTITITGTLNNVGRGLWRPHNINNICEVRAKNSSGTTVLATSQFAPNSVTVINSLNSDGSANIVFQATGITGGTTLQRIEFRDILSYNSDIKTYSSSSPSCPQTSTSPIIPKWLFNDSTYGNNWHQVAYYAVSQGYAPGGNHTCTTPCLTVNGQGGGGNKQAVVVMTSGALATQPTHPTGTLADYLELENATPIPPLPTDYTYENKTHSSTFNDQVIIVAP